MSDFAELLKSLEAAANEQEQNAASGGDDGQIQAAADDAGITDANPEDNEGEGEGKPMAKSMTATGEDGEVVEVVDATEMLKSLQDGLASQGDVLAKALTSMTNAFTAQGKVLKSLQAEVAALKGQGRGRKAVVSVAERTDASTLAKSNAAADANKVTPQQFMAKCLAAQRSGTISGFDVSRAEIAINNGVPVPQDIVSAVMASK